MSVLAYDLDSSFLTSFGKEVQFEFEKRTQAALSMLMGEDRPTPKGPQMYHRNNQENDPPNRAYTPSPLHDKDVVLSSSEEALEDGLSFLIREAAHAIRHVPLISSPSFVDPSTPIKGPTDLIEKTDFPTHIPLTKSTAPDTQVHDADVAWSDDDDSLFQDIKPSTFKALDLHIKPSVAPPQPLNRPAISTSAPTRGISRREMAKKLAFLEKEWATTKQQLTHRASHHPPVDHPQHIQTTSTAASSSSHRELEKKIHALGQQQRLLVKLLTRTEPPLSAPLFFSDHPRTHRHCHYHRQQQQQQAQAQAQASLLQLQQQQPPSQQFILSSSSTRQDSDLQSETTTSPLATALLLLQRDYATMKEAYDLQPSLHRQRQLDAKQQQIVTVSSALQWLS